MFRLIFIILCCLLATGNKSQPLNGSQGINFDALTHTTDSLLQAGGLDPHDIKQAAYDSAYVSLMQLMIRQHHRTDNVLAWQTTSSRIIFVVVILIVLCGLVFSGIQFFQAAKSKDQFPVSELEMSLKGIKLHSSVLGLLILVISIAFFYLYLHYVYPVTFIK